MKTDGDVRIVLEDVDLPGELVGVEPVVVAFAQGQVVASRATERIDDVLVDADVRGPQDRTNDVRVAVGVLPDDVRVESVDPSSATMISLGKSVSCAMKPSGASRMYRSWL